MIVANTLTLFTREAYSTLATSVQQGIGMDDAHSATLSAGPTGILAHSDQLHLQTDVFKQLDCKDYVNICFWFKKEWDNRPKAPEVVPPRENADGEEEATKQQSYMQHANGTRPSSNYTSALRRYCREGFQTIFNNGQAR